MNKQDLISAVAATTALSKTDTATAIDAVFDIITAELKAGGDVRLVGFGSFSVSARPARDGRNPRTGETIKIAAAKQPKFSAGKALKEAIA